MERQDSRTEMKRFHDRVAVVTGAASGIGEATAMRLASEGASVVVVDMSAAGSDVAARIAGLGGKASFISADVADERQWDAIRDAAHEFGRAYTLVSNAFTADVAAAHEMSLDSWQRQLSVNLTATFLGVRALLSDLRESNGSVVIVSSIHANFGFPGHPAYAAAKGGLISLGRQLAVEYSPDLRVNAVLPGPIWVPRWNDVPKEDRDSVERSTLARRFGTADETAAAIAFLASEDASYVNATTLVVDGGATAFLKGMR